MFDHLRKRYHVVAALFLALYFFPLLWLSAYDYPSGDDWQTFLKAREMGALGATRWAYFNWSGRYSSFLLQHALAAHGDWFLSYKIVPAVVLVLSFLCTYNFALSLFGSGFDRRACFAISAVLYALVVSASADVTTAFYWLPTNAQYTGGVFLSLTIFALNLRLARAATARARASLSVAIAALIFVVAGLNEVSILFVICGYLSVVCFQLFKRGRLYRHGLLFLALSLAFGSASLFAPGNLSRMGLTTQKFHAAEVLAASVGLTLYFFAELFTTTALVPASALYLLLVAAKRERLAAPLSLFSDLNWRWTLVTLLGCVTLCNVALFTALGVGVDALPYRLRNAYVYSIILGWFFFLTIVGARRSPRAEESRAPRWLAALLALSVLLYFVTGFQLKLASRALPSSGWAQTILCLLTTRSVPITAYEDIFSGRAARYARLNEERARLVRDATGDAVDVPLYSYVPDTIFLQDVNHPWGAPEMLSRAVNGRVLQFHYVETGPPAPRKEGH